MDIASLSAISGIENISKYADIVYRRKNQKEAAQQALTVC